MSAQKDIASMVESFLAMNAAGALSSPIPPMAVEIITTLQAKLAEAEKDAARYRHSIAYEDNAEDLYSTVLCNAGDKVAIDAEVDAAIAQNGKESFDQREWKENNLPVAERNRAKE